MNDYYKLEESKKLIASIGDVGSTVVFPKCKQYIDFLNIWFPG